MTQSSTDIPGGHCGDTAPNVTPGTQAMGTAGMGQRSLSPFQVLIYHPSFWEKVTRHLLLIQMHSYSDRTGKIVCSAHSYKSKCYFLRSI